MPIVCRHTLSTMLFGPLVLSDLHCSSRVGNSSQVNSVRTNTLHRACLPRFFLPLQKALRILSHTPPSNQKPSESAVRPHPIALRLPTAYPIHLLCIATTTILVNSKRFSTFSCALHPIANPLSSARPVLRSCLDRICVLIHSPILRPTRPIDRQLLANQRTSEQTINNSSPITSLDPKP